ncbi:MAG: [protein-PII] uridylyltransferase [Halieaceae bacterium]|jgi:[protein-PII] uridylyltransferase|nr:[protein-PII] uridylyltransferase [Halieaceae bacterium]
MGNLRVGDGQRHFDVGAVPPDISTESLCAILRDVIERAGDTQDREFIDGRSVSELLRERAALIDEVLGVLWRHFRVDAGSGVALVAVGGYGRGELHPCSDIDLLVLQRDDTDPPAGLEAFMTVLWDLGLKIGHSVRSVSECLRQARDDVSVLTNLIEARLLRGDAALLEAVEDGIAAPRMWPAEAFFGAKLREQEARHAKFADTEYSLEPNVKSSPGGLRDLQLIGWLARRHFGWRELSELTANRFLTDAEATTIVHGQEFMWRVRYALHMFTGREEDRLIFDHQRELAKLWGFQDGDKLAVEQFMQLYYRWALALSQLNEVLLLSFDQAVLQSGREQEIIPLDDYFELRNGYVCTLRSSVFQEHPGALLEVFQHAGNDPRAIGISAQTIRLIRENRHLIDEAYRADPANKQRFMALLRGNERLTRQLRRMSRYGILGRYLPAFGQVVGQMQHDLFHSYTVDAHTLLVIENMRRFMQPENDERFPVTSRVARRLPKRELLYIAGLFHDIGKGRGGDHSELGAVDARRFCESHGLSRRDTNLVEWLVRNHLLMSAVAQRKDISDPEVVQQFARHVGDQNRLDYLFALTVADINGTNPKLWNAWRGSLLRKLYAEAKRALQRGLENPVDRREWVEETRAAANKILEYRGFTPTELNELWRERGDYYFLREKAEDIAWHTEAIATHLEVEQPLVLVRNSAESNVANTTQIFVYARFDIEAFARTCSCLEQLNLSIHDARIYHGSDGMSLDTYYVLDRMGTAIEDPERLKHIRSVLASRLGDDKDRLAIVPRLTPRRVRSFHVATETSVGIDEQRGISVLEVVSLDRPGLLARIGEVFIDFRIVCQAAKIQTLGERVEDVFFITDTQQQPLRDEALIASLQNAIRDKLDGAEAA